MHKVFRRLAGALFTLLAAATLSLTAAGTASAKPPADCKGGSDSTGDAFACAVVYYDGGTKVQVWVEDRAGQDGKGDGKCAHGALRWLHDNGNYYYDYGMYVCGVGATGYWVKGPRNQTQYQKVDLLIFVDNGPDRVIPLAGF